MTNDIKEILDYLKEDDDKDNWGYVKDKLLAYEEGIKLLDYITNLQEEKERLQQRNDFLNSVCIGFDEKYENYKSRNEKAIEYIKENADYGIQEKCCMNDLNYDECDILLNILQGSDKE